MGYEGGSKFRKGDKGAEKGSVDPERWARQAVMSWCRRQKAQKRGFADENPDLH